MIKNETLAAKTASCLSRIQPGLSSNGLLPIAFLVVVFVVFSIFARNFFSVITVLNLLTQTSPIVILAIG